MDPTSVQCRGLPAQSPEGRDLHGPPRLSMRGQAGQLQAGVVLTGSQTARGVPGSRGCPWQTPVPAGWGGREERGHFGESSKEVQLLPCNLSPEDLGTQKKLYLAAWELVAGGDQAPACPQKPVDAVGGGGPCVDGDPGWGVHRLDLEEWFPGCV